MHIDTIRRVFPPEEHTLAAAVIADALRLAHAATMAGEPIDTDSITTSITENVSISITSRQYNFVCKNHSPEPTRGIQVSTGAAALVEEI
jgi:hypothetical protein